MPANMMMAAVGLEPYVSGRSKAIAAEGPMPGRMPTICPSSTPAKHMARCVGVRAVAKPCMRSNQGPMSDSQWAGRQGHAEPCPEDQDERRGRRARNDYGTEKREPFHSLEEKQQKEEHGDAESRRLDAECGRRQGREDHQGLCDR